MTPTTRTPIDIVCDVQLRHPPTTVRLLDPTEYRMNAATQGEEVCIGVLHDPSRIYEFSFLAPAECGLIFTHSKKNERTFDPIPGVREGDKERFKLLLQIGYSSEVFKVRNADGRTLTVTFIVWMTRDHIDKEIEDWRERTQPIDPHTPQARVTVPERGVIVRMTDWFSSLRH